MSAAKESFVYVKGDTAKKPVDPAKQPEGTDLVMVLASGKEIDLKDGFFQPVDEAAVAARKASMGPAEVAKLAEDKAKAKAKADAKAKEDSDK